MRYLSHLARRTAHLLTLESFALAALVFPLQLSRESLQILLASRDRALGVAGRALLTRLGLNPESVWRYDVSAFLNSGFDPLILKECLFKGAITLALLAWVVSHLLRAGLPGARRLAVKRLIWLVAMVGVLTLSIMLGTRDGEGGRRMVWLQSRSYFMALAGLGFLILMLDFLRCRRAADRWIAFIYLVSAPVMAVALIQHLGDVLLPQGRIQWMGVIPLVRSAENPRNVIGSLIGHNNGVALLAVPGLMMAPGVWLRMRRIWLKTALAIWVLLALWVLVRAQSRSVLLSLTLAVVLWTIVSRIWLPRPEVRIVNPKLRRWLMIVAALFLLFQVVPNPLRSSAGLGERLSRLVNLRDLATDTRVRVAVTGLPAFRDRFITGWGIGSFSWVFPIYQGRYFNDSNNIDTTLAPTTKLTQRAHNDWLQLAIEMGVLGLVVVVWGIVLLWGRGWRFARSGCPPAYRAILAGSLCAGLAFAFQALFDFPLHVTPTALMALVLLAMVSNAPEIWGLQRLAQPSEPNLKLFRWLALAAVAVWCLWPTWWWPGAVRPQNPSHMAPSLSRLLRGTVSGLLADERHIHATANLDRYLQQSAAGGIDAESIAVLAEAESLLRSAALIDPPNGWVRHRLGEVLTYRGDQFPRLHRAALDQFAIALEEVRSHITLYYVGECHLALSLWEDEECSRMEAMGDMEGAQRAAQLQSSHRERAINSFRLAHRLNPADPYTSDRLARLLMQEGFWRAAAAVLEDMRRWTPDAYQERWVRRAIVDLDLERWDRVLEELRVLHEVEPENALFLHMAALCHLRSGDADRARPIIETLHRQHPDLEFLGELDIELMVVEGNFEAAASEGLAFSERVGGNLHALCLSHLALRRLGRDAEAREVMDEIVRVAEEQGNGEASAMEILGNMAWDLFDDPSTAEVFYRAIVDNPPGPVVLLYYRLALRAAERGNRSEALDLLARLRALTHEFGPAETLWNSLTRQETLGTP